MWIVLAAVCSIVVPTPPCLGATYKGSIAVPMFGEQSVALHILDESYGQVLLKGLMEADEIFSYAYYHDDEYTFWLSQRLEERLRKRFCTIQRATFDCERDEACVYCTVLSIPMKITLVQV